MGKTSKPRRHGRNWRIRWTDHRGIRCSKTFKSFSNANTCLLIKLAEKEQIIAGKVKPILEGKTVNDLCDHWEEHVVIRLRSAKDHHSIIRGHLRKKLGHMLLKNITAEVIDRYKFSTRHLSNKTVNNHLTLLSSMLNHAVEMAWLSESPKIKK